jgi:pSer/pThr/pTyr-binding forkhead associated (FHA) protein
MCLDRKAEDDPGVESEIARQFLTACGASKPLELEARTESGASAGRWILAHPCAVIGRDAQADLILPHEAVSKRHAYLQILNGRVFAQDLESRGGIALDGMAIESAWLLPGRSLEIGPYRIRLIGEEDSGLPPPPTQLATRQPHALSRGEAIVEIPHRSAPTGNLRFRVKRTLTFIGRSPLCRLRILDDALSRFHAALVETGDGLWVVDLGSREGIRVNRQPVRFAPLQGDDLLHVGPYRMRIRFLDTGASDPQDDPLTLRPHEETLPALRPNAGPSTLSHQASSRVHRLQPHTPLPIAEPDVTSGVVQAVVSILEPLLHQIGSMQQMMFEQHQQSMGLISQLVSSLHREQRGQAQAELDRIREIGDELQTLQQRLTAGLAHAAEPQSAHHTAQPSSPHIPGDTSSPPSLAPEADKPAQPSAPDMASAQAVPKPPHHAKPVHHPADSDIDDSLLHADICARIETLQGERRTRWQKLVHLVTGGTAAG